MYLCSDGHDEICCESKYCPVCEAQREVEILEKKVAELEAEVEKLEQYE